MTASDPGYRPTTGFSSLVLFLGRLTIMVLIAIITIPATLVTSVLLGLFTLLEWIVLRIRGQQSPEPL